HMISPVMSDLVVLLTGTVICRPVGHQSKSLVSVTRRRSTYWCILGPHRAAGNQNPPASVLPRRADPADALEATWSSRQGHDGALGLVLDDGPRPVGGVQRQAEEDGSAVVLQEAPRPAVAVRQRRPRLAVAVEQAQPGLFMPPRGRSPSA